MAKSATRDVERWLRENSKRPRQAAELWSLLLDDAHPDTGQITLTRDRIAARLGMAPGNVSRIMTELERSGAIARRRDGRRVRYSIASAAEAGPKPAGEPEPEEARDSAEKRAGRLEARLEETNRVLARWRDRARRAEKAEDELRRHKLARRRNRVLAALLILAAAAGAWWAGWLGALGEVFRIRIAG